MKQKLIAYLLTCLETPAPIITSLPRKKRGSIAVYVMGEFLEYIG